MMRCEVSRLEGVREPWAWEVIDDGMVRARGRELTEAAAAAEAGRCLARLKAGDGPAGPAPPPAGGLPTTACLDAAALACEVLACGLRDATSPAGCVLKKLTLPGGRQAFRLEADVALPGGGSVRVRVDSK
jgi:hypothetical protein